MKSLTSKMSIIRCMITLAALAVGITSSQAQPKQMITGVIMEEGSRNAVPYANIALFDATGDILIGGAISNMDGAFELNCDSAAAYRLRISAVGYETVFQAIDNDNEEMSRLGEILLPVSKINLEGIIVVGERVKAVSGAEKTTFNVSKKMAEASNTGTDVLKLIPGVQVDLRQNVSLEGSSEILILVDGRERDRSFLSQLPAGKIDQIEVLSAPSSKYDAAVTGVINIVLNKKQDSGFDGQVYVEVPTSDSEIYLFPAYSLNYGFKKLNLFTSYNGELAYLNIEEKQRRKLYNDTEIDEIISTQHIRQKNWSHRFHYGFDYFIDEKNQVNFYAYYNPYSWEHDGHVELKTNGNNETDWFANREDNDMNHSAFYSLYYKHAFNGSTGHEIAVDASLYNLNAENSTTYHNNETGYHQVNSVSPQQNSASLKVDYSLPLSAGFKLNAGVQSKKQVMEDELSGNFKWEEETYAGYAALNHKTEKFDVQAGARYEFSSLGLKGEGNNNFRALLPNVAASYKINTSQNLRFSYRGSVAYPQLYHLNPYQAVDDPFSIRSGNPGLKPEYRQNISIEHSRRFEHSYIATRLFYIKTTDAINYLTHINGNGIFETRPYNSGELHRFGIQFTGAISIGNTISFNPYLRLFEVNTRPNSIAAEKGIAQSRTHAMESGFSAVASFKHNITASVMFQYATPVREMQRSYFSGALYFVSVEKAFGQGFKAGMVSGIPFSKTFIYQGYEIDAPDFSSRSEGVVSMSAIPLWFKFSYQFSSGKKRSGIDRATETYEQQPRKGF